MSAIAIDWKSPDYEAVYRVRGERISRLRGEENQDAIWAGIKAFYKDHPVEFINDWGMTVDPRNPEVNLPALIPFVMFPKQVEFVEWLVKTWRNREDGLVEKSRDMGASWCSVAFAVWMWLFYPGTSVGFGSRKEEYVDKLGDPKSLFWKLRQYIAMLPHELLPVGYSEKLHAPSMRITNPENGAAIVGEAGDNIGRGNRTSIYFKDESAHYDHPEMIDAALSNTTNCQIDISSVNGVGNPFYVKRHSGRVPVFVFDWRDDPRKDQAWYDKQVATRTRRIIAQEIDRDYESSIDDAFIPADIVNAASMRGPADIQQPRCGLRVGVDVARFGSDRTAITLRRGRVLLKVVTLEKFNVEQVASRVRAEVSAYGEIPEQIAVDTIGIGAGVADILRGWYPPRRDRVSGRTIDIVVDVNCSIRMGNGAEYNLRAFMWREMRDWLAGASIPRNEDLKRDLTAIRYDYKGGELILESKDDAKNRGVRSPDIGDSLAITFAYPTIPVIETGPRRGAIPQYRHSDPAMGL